MMRLAGVNEGLDVGSRSAFTQARQRVGWLIATGCAGLFADRIIHFLGPAGRLDVLAGFIPVVMGMGGNVGVQSATIAVRGIATGHVAIAGARAFIFREARVGSMLGLGYGLTIGAYGLVFGDGPRVGLVVGLAVFIAILLGSLLGSGMPILLSRFKVDPAVATGPFVTSTVDLIAIVVYLSLATALAA
jgi:magnesium transporter